MTTKTFPGRYDSLVKISKFVQENAESVGFDDQQLYAIEMAVDEACSNIIDHAYGGENRGNIVCTCEPFAGGIKVILLDHGQAFNPETVPDPDLVSGIEDREERGLGLFFMRRLMDEVHFEFSARKGNCLTMIKRSPKNTG